MFEGRKGGFDLLRGGLMAGALAVLVVGCGVQPEGGEGNGGEGGEGSGEEAIRVGMITSTTGPLATYGEQFIQGFEIGLGYATDGSGEVAGQPVEITQRDDAGDPANAVSAATDLIGQGYTIITGAASSGVAVQLAPVAEQNQALFISGPAATDEVTGANDYTFRSGRQSYQDVQAASSLIGDPEGQTVTVFAQDSTFGQANVAAVDTVLGGQGAEVDEILVPAEANDFTPFAQQAQQAESDLVFAAWAGTNAPAMWQSLDQQGVFDASPIVTGLDIRASYETYGPAAENIEFLAHYFADAPETEANDFLAEELEAQEVTPDLFHPDGFVAAQMVVHAAEESGGDVDAMVEALEGWSFEAPKGEQTIRESDHAMLQPMFQARLTEQDGALEPELIDTLDAEQTAPPEASEVE